MPKSIPSTALTQFQCMLIGTWKNDDALKKDGRHLSYNVMPLPQIAPQPTRPAAPPNKYGGFILKNFSFTEEIRFNGSLDSSDAAHGHYDPEAIAMIASAPNRGGSYTQSSHAVFYDQLVRFAEGPEEGKVVHVENGAWLHFGSEPQVLGPYSNSGKHVPGQVLRQPPYVRIAKQISVPHGNSVLALGNVDTYAGECFDPDDRSGTSINTIIDGAPVIPDALPPYPQAKEDNDFGLATVGIASDPYSDPYSLQLANNDGFENPTPNWTLNPNYPLQYAVQQIEPSRHIHWRVTTRPLFGGDGSVTNVPFEDRRSRVTEYWADYWLMESDCEFNYLAYTQTILMEMDMSLDNGNTFQRYIFPHVTTNVVKKVDGTPSDARQQDRDQIPPVPSKPKNGRKSPKGD